MLDRLSKAKKELVEVNASVHERTLDLIDYAQCLEGDSLDDIYSWWYGTSEEDRNLYERDPQVFVQSDGVPFCTEGKGPLSFMTGALYGYPCYLIPGILYLGTLDDAKQIVDHLYADAILNREASMNKEEERKRENKKKIEAAKSKLTAEEIELLQNSIRNK